MGYAKAKQHIFNRGVTALSNFTGVKAEGYLCPICLRCFDGPGDLTEEHVPPQSIGGDVLCLTCRDCNCGAGHSIDAEMHREQQSRSFLAVGETPRRALISAGEHQARVNLRHDESGFHLDVLKSQNDPKMIEPLKEAVARLIALEGSINVKDTVSYHRPTADVGYLKSAYLAAFAKLGYRYILRDALDRVREQILTPVTRVLPTVRVYTQGAKHLPKALRLAQEPLQCLVVTVGDSVVCLPSIEGEDSFYEALEEMRLANDRRQWRFVGTIAWPRGAEFALDG